MTQQQKDFIADTTNHFGFDTSPTGAGPSSGNFVTTNTTGGVQNEGAPNGVPEVLAGGTPTLEVAPSLWQAGSNAATQAGQQDFAAAQAAGSVAAPTIQNPYAASSMAGLNATRGQYGALDQGLQQTASGGGINAGQAQYQQAQGQGIASALAAARGGHGGYSVAGGAAGGAGLAGSLSGAATQAANTRAAQVGQAQSALGSSLSAQGGMNLSEYGTQQNDAQSQASLAEQQQQINQSQQLALYNQSLQQQGAQLNAINESGQATDAATGLSIQQQQLNNQQIGTEIGTAAKVGGTVLAVA